MKNEREIREQIDKMMEEQSRRKNAHEDYENLCNQIDALLWVIGDRSGAPIWGEVR